MSKINPEVINLKRTPTKAEWVKKNTTFTIRQALVKAVDGDWDMPEVIKQWLIKHEVIELSQRYQRLVFTKRGYKLARQLHTHGAFR